MRPRSARLRGAWLAGISLIGCLCSAVLAQTSHDPIGSQADAHMATARRLFDAGDFQGALGEWADARDLLEPAGDPRARCRVRLGQGASYVSLGRYADAVEALEQALALAEELGDAAFTVMAKGSLGNAYLLGGRVEEARSLLGEALHAARALERYDVAATSGNDLGTLLASQQDYDGALAAYSQAIEDARRAGSEGSELKARVNSARALRDRGQVDAARSELEAVTDSLRGVEASHDKAYALISVGRLYASLQDPSADGRDRAHAAFRDAAELAESIGDARALSYALGYQGNLYEQAARPDEALQLTRRALFLAQQSGADELLYRWQWQIGRLLRARGDRAEAIQAYRQAVQSLQSIRSDLLAGYGTRQATFREQVGPVFLELADLMLEHAKTLTDSEQRQAALRQARETVELLKGAELADYFQDDCVAALKSRTAGIDELAGRTAAIYPIVLPDRLEILASLPGGMKLFTSPVSGEVLTLEIRSMRKLLEQRITHQYRGHARRVYDWLIRPLEGELEREGIETLVFVPDGPFRTIPIAALHDGKGFLINRFAVATTPGLTLTDPRPIERHDVRLLLNGLTEGVQGFPPLPNVELEIERIQSLYGGTLLENEAFKTAAVADELTTNPYSIVHIASHGKFSKDARESFLLTYDGKLDMNSLEQYMSMTGLRTQPVELLTLSACQTAAGDDRAALGLAGVAVKAGARSALATLWFINDRASSLLVSEFYRRLQDSSISKAKALQLAQLELMKDRFYRHPGYWAPFLLIGNWL